MIQLYLRPSFFRASTAAANPYLRTTHAVVRLALLTGLFSISAFGCADHEAEKRAEIEFKNGNMCNISGEYDMAIAHFSAAIKLLPDNAGAHHGRGAAYVQKGEYDKAIADLSEALRQYPDSQRLKSYFLRGEAYIGKGDFRSAIADYSNALRLEPNFRLALAGRAMAYEQLGDTEQAARDFAKAKELGWNE